MRPQRVELTEHLSTSTWAVSAALSSKAQQRTKQRAWVSGLSASRVPCPLCGAVARAPGESTTGSRAGDGVWVWEKESPVATVA